MWVRTPYYGSETALKSDISSMLRAPPRAALHTRPSRCENLQASVYVLSRSEGSSDLARTLGKPIPSVWAVPVPADKRVVMLLAHVHLDPVQNHVGNLQIVAVHHQHVAVAAYAKLRQLPDLSIPACSVDLPGHVAAIVDIIRPQCF